eukprot:6333583-Amphidinium_carterae.1
MLCLSPTWQWPVVEGACESMSVPTCQSQHIKPLRLKHDELSHLVIFTCSLRVLSDNFDLLDTGDFDFKVLSLDQKCACKVEQGCQENELGRISSREWNWKNQLKRTDMEESAHEYGT